MDMPMYFNFTVTMSNVLFYGFNSTDSLEFLPILLFFAAMAFCIEFAKSWREYASVVLTYRTPPSRRHRPSNVSISASSTASTSYGTGGAINDAEDPLSLDNSLAMLQPFASLPANVNQLRKFRVFKLLQAGLAHVIQLMLGYLLMLGVMTYNVWILITVICASGMGYWLGRSWYIKTEAGPTPPSNNPAARQLPGPIGGGTSIVENQNFNNALESSDEEGLHAMAPPRHSPGAFAHPPRRSPPSNNPAARQLPGPIIGGGTSIGENQNFTNTLESSDEEGLHAMAPPRHSPGAFAHPPRRV